MYIYDVVKSKRRHWFAVTLSFTLCGDRQTDRHLQLMKSHNGKEKRNSPQSLAGSPAETRVLTFVSRNVPEHDKLFFV